jgi:hypothetical protein
LHRNVTAPFELVNKFTALASLCSILIAFQVVFTERVMIYLSCSAYIEVEGVTVIQPWFLNSTDFYERVSKEDLEVFRRICPRQHYQKGSYIFRSGDPASELHLIEEGRVKLVSLTPTGGARILAFCGHGDFIGEAFLKEKNRYRADAVALSEVATCPMSRTQFLQLLTPAHLDQQV